MKPAMIIGLVLIVLGIGAIVYKGITYTTREKIIDIGPLEASVDTKETIPLSPIFGGLSIVGGIALVIIGRRKP